MMVRRAHDRALTDIHRTSRRLLIVRIVAAVVGITCFSVWFAVARPAVFGGPVITIAVNGHSMDPTYAPGDFLLVRADSSYDVGDIVVYRVPEGNPGAGARIVHRIAAGDGETGWIMKGDHNSTSDPWQPTDADVVGRVWIRVPKVASVFAHLRNPTVLATTIALLTFGMLVMPKHSLRKLWDWFSN